MKMGNVVVALVDKLAKDGLSEVRIPEGATGIVCEVYDDFALVEIWGEEKK